MRFGMTTLSYFDRDNPSLPFLSNSDQHIRKFPRSYSSYHSKNKKYKNSSNHHSNNSNNDPSSHLTADPNHALPLFLKFRHTQSKFRKQYEQRHRLIFLLRAQERKNTRNRLFRREQRIHKNGARTEGAGTGLTFLQMALPLGPR